MRAVISVVRPGQRVPLSACFVSTLVLRKGGPGEARGGNQGFPVAFAEMLPPVVEVTFSSLASFERFSVRSFGTWFGVCVEFR